MNTTLCFNPKFLLVASLDLTGCGPFLVASVPVPPTFADVAAEKQWTAKTPDLLWIPATSPGIIRWIGYMGKKATQAGLKFTKSQSAVLSDLPDHIATTLRLNAKSELALGEKRAANRLPVDPTWIPEIEEAQAIMGAIVRFDGARPWDGYRAPVYAAPPKGDARQEEKAASVEPKATPKERKPGKRTFANHARERDAAPGLW